MEEQKEKNSIAEGEEFPHNLLSAIVGQTSLVPPETMSSDRLSGLQYALSTLDDREQEVILQRFRDHRSRSEIGLDFGISPERIRQIENKTIRKLREPSRWNYIKLGVAGYMQKRTKDFYSQGYNAGYKSGYETGVHDEQNGVKLAYQDSKLLNLTIENMNLSIRSFNCLKRVNCERIGDVARLRDEEISTMRNLGKKSADEIARKLNELGIQYTEWDKYILV